LGFSFLHRRLPCDGVFRREHAANDSTAPAEQKHRLFAEQVPEPAVALNAWGRALRFNAPGGFWNLFGEQAVFLLSRRG